MREARQSIGTAYKTFKAKRGKRQAKEEARAAANKGKAAAGSSVAKRHLTA